MPFRILYADTTVRHFEFLTPAQRKLVFDRVDEQLMHTPTEGTRNRKLMRPNPLATRELRIGRFRVFYDVLAQPEPTVLIVAVGIKERGVLHIAGEVFPL